MGARNKTIIRQPKVTTEGTGVVVNRLMPVPDFMNYDPFVLCDHFEINFGAGFPDHPHRDFEAITFLFHGSMQHADNIWNRSVITQGGAQCFTAGSGIVHSEMQVTKGVHLAYSFGLIFRSV